MKERYFYFIISLVFGLQLNQAAASESLYAIVRRDTAKIVNSGLVENCASRFLFDVAIQDSTLRVTERDTSTRFTTCQCGFDLSVTIAGLAQGSYRADVYRSHEFPQHWERFVGTVRFTILVGGVVAGVAHAYQSPCGPSSVEPPLTQPTEFALRQNYPNPFNPTTTIEYELPDKSFVRLSVFNLLGEEVATLVNEVQGVGFKSVAFDASKLSNGVYFYRLQANGFTKTMKMVATK